MDHRLNIRPRFVNFAVDKTFHETGCLSVAEWFAVQVVNDNVARCD